MNKDHCDNNAKEYFPFISVDEQTQDEVKDDRRSNLDDWSYYYYYDDDLFGSSSSSTTTNCNHKYFSGIASSPQLQCDSCKEIIGEWKFSFTYSLKTFPPSQYSTYKIYPYLRGLTLEEIQDFK
jgi:hypothetical protein